MRSRSHILEEESIFHFRRLLPEQWVIREKAKDYGIDAEVEIFTEAGNYTGLVFWVQLKATDSLKKAKQLSVRMPISKIKQLSSYELPVAIFRYNSENQTFYFDWLSRHSYLSASSLLKSYDIIFEEYQIWSINSSQKIIAFLKNRVKFLERSFSFPLRTFINATDGTYKIGRRLASNISKEISQINITRDANCADLEINILKNRIVLNLCNCYGASIGIDQLDTNDEIEIFKAFKTAFCLILHQTDKSDTLINFIYEHDLTRTIMKNEKVFHYLLSELVINDITNKITFEILDYCFTSNDFTASAVIQASIFLAPDSKISQERIESYYNYFIDLSKKTSDNKSLAKSFYNFATYYRKINILDKSLNFYNKALKTDNSYLDQGYFCQELGGILFDLQRFSTSLKFYKKALELDPKNIFLLATTGDAEFYVGNYKKAQEYFDQFLNDPDHKNHNKYEYSLKFTICDALIQCLGTESQIRDSKKSYEYFISKSSLTLEKEDLDILLNLDALNPIVWGQYSLIFLKESEFEMVFISTLIQSVVVKNHSKIWAYLSILTTYPNAPIKLLYDIVNTAYFYCKEDYLLELQNAIELDDYKNFKGSEFIEHVENLIIAPKRGATYIRLWNDGEGNPTVLEF